MNKFKRAIPLLSILVAAGFATQAAATVVFYEHEGFQGRSFSTDKQVANFQQYGFNDMASSVVVLNDRWEICENARFGGRCIVLRPGRYPSLNAMNIGDRISSVRMVSSNARLEDSRYAPTPMPVYDNQRRNRERVFEADVTSVHAVVASSGQRCWVEHQQVSGDRGGVNVPGAVVGALIGGVLGHQVGSGRGNDAATVGGAVIGGAVGSNVGRDGGQRGYTQDVQRCENTSQGAHPEYWDVTYNFRGQEHRIQMASPPGRTVTVNAQGEPRA